VMVVVFGFLFFVEGLVTGNVIWEPPVVNNCGDVDIQTMWDSIFVESSSEITILKEGKEGGDCENFAAYKTKADGGVWVLMNSVSHLGSGNKSSKTVDFSYFNGSSGEIRDFNNPKVPINFSFLFELMDRFRFLENNHKSLEGITNRSLAFTDATSEFTKYFKIPSPTFKNYGSHFSFEEVELEEKIIIKKYLKFTLYTTESINLIRYSVQDPIFIDSGNYNSGDYDPPYIVATLGSEENVSSPNVNKNGGTPTSGSFDKGDKDSSVGKKSNSSTSLIGRIFGGFRKNVEQGEGKGGWLSLVFWIVGGLVIVGGILFLIYFLVLKKRNIRVNTMPSSVPIAPNPVKDYIEGLNLEKK